MADTYEKDLAQKTTLTANDYIRVVGTDNVSYKQKVSDVATPIIDIANTGAVTSCTAVSSSLSFGSQNKVFALNNRLVQVTVVFTLSASVSAGTTLFTVPKTMRIAGLFPCRLDSGAMYLIGNTNNQSSDIKALQDSLPAGNYRATFVYIADIA